MIGSRHLAPFFVSNGTCAVGCGSNRLDPVHPIVGEIVFVERGGV